MWRSRCPAEQYRSLIKNSSCFLTQINQAISQNNQLLVADHDGHGMFQQHSVKCVRPSTIAVIGSFLPFLEPSFAIYETLSYPDEAKGSKGDVMTKPSSDLCSSVVRACSWLCERTRRTEDRALEIESMMPVTGAMCARPSLHATSDRLVKSSSHTDRAIPTAFGSKGIRF